MVSEKLDCEDINFSVVAQDNTQRRDFCYYGNYLSSGLKCTAALKLEAVCSFEKLISAYKSTKRYN
jgi:hypothetical protein